MGSDRLDVTLVRRGLARSRAHAVTLVEARAVRVQGVVATRPALPVAADAAIAVSAREGGRLAEFAYVSRAALKLIGALDAFPSGGPVIAGRRWLDAGASTGGFTQVLLERGASQVIAADVGSGQLADVVRADPRVDVREHTNVRDVTFDVDGVVADLSFISLRLVLPALLGSGGADAVVLVKPQFEVGRKLLGAGGVVRTPEHRVAAVRGVVATAAELGWGVYGAVPSPLPGSHGNVEYVLWLRRGPHLTDAEIVAAITPGSPA